MLVVDTNVLIYATLGGPGRLAAEAVLRRDPAWAAPPLWRSEFRQVLTRYIRKGELTVADAGALLATADALVGGRERAPDSESVLTMAVASGCSAYDCEFVALARELGTALVTGDRQVAAAFPDLAIALTSFE